MGGDWIGYEPGTGGSGGTITGTAPIIVSGSNVSLQTQTGITAGSYTSANITVTNKGIISSISNGGGGGSAPALPLIYIGTLGVNSIAGFSMSELKNYGAFMAYPRGSANMLGTPDLELGGAAVDGNASWMLNFTGNSTADNSLLLRKRSVSGTWSTVDTVPLAAGDQFYSGTIALLAGEAWGAFFDFWTTFPSFTYFAFYGA